MPISRKQFESGNFRQRSVKGEANYVLAFLRKNNKAYRANEIAKEVKRTSSTVRQILGKLIKSGLVMAKIPYYIAVEKTTKKEVHRKKK